MRWIIGDVHGMLRPLEVLLEAILRRDASAELYFAGDYCDRGPNTKGVVDLLLSLDRAHFVRGNHDDVMDLCLSGKSLATGPNFGGNVDEATATEVKELFLGEGLLETLTSYGADLRELGRGRGNWAEVLKWIDEGMAKVPEAHRTFFRNLPAITETEDFFVAHATWPADYNDTRGRMNSTVAGDPYLRHDVLWGRYVSSQLTARKVWSRIGFFGHTPTDNYIAGGQVAVEPGQIIRGEKLILLDTAAFSPSGRLTGVCFDDRRILQVSHAGTLLS